MRSGPAGDPTTTAAARLVQGVRAVVFDLDGVLVDTEPWWHEVRLSWAAARGRTWTRDDSLACMGRNSREWAAIMRARLDVDDTPDEIQEAIVSGLVARYAAMPVPVVPGAAQAAAEIAGRLPVAIASSAHPAVIRAAVDAAGLRALFGIIVSSDDVPAGKPAPDVYLEVARRLGVAPGDCLVVEDSSNGVLAGRAAGMRVVLVPNSSVAPGPGAAETADLVVRRLADLPIASMGAAA